MTKLSLVIPTERSDEGYPLTNQDEIPRLSPRNDNQRWGHPGASRDPFNRADKLYGFPPARE